MKEKKVPFFAQFLENEIKVSNKANGGGLDVTNKHPSDSDEATHKSIDGVIFVTDKYPSDSDEATSKFLDDFRR